MRSPTQTQAKSSFTPVRTGLLQRKCASCGQHATTAGLCGECQKKRSPLQRRSTNQAEPSEVPPIVHEVLRSPGQPLDLNTRTFMESRFGHDFSRVRVHSDALAAESAQAVNALAYTVSRDIVFGAGQYALGTTAGKQLLAHELTHVVQQANTDASTLNRQLSRISSQANLEAEADRNARNIDSAQTLSVSHVTAGANVMRDEASTPTTSSGCTTTRQDAINRARLAAFVRCQIAYQRVAGIGPPPPPGRQDPAQEWQRRARFLARKIFNEDLNMDQVADIIGTMRGRLTPSLPIVCAASNDQNCGQRAGYVLGFRPPVYLCPAFFSGSDEQRTRTMIHEAAHLAGIGEAIGESYCGEYDCETSCGGFDVADSWSHYVHCLSGQTPDVPITVQGRQP